MIAKLTTNSAGSCVEYFPHDGRLKSSGTQREIIEKLISTDWHLASFAMPERGWEVWIFERHE